MPDRYLTVCLPWQQQCANYRNTATMHCWPASLLCAYYERLELNTPQSRMVAQPHSDESLAHDCASSAAAATSETSNSCPRRCIEWVPRSDKDLNSGMERHIIRTRSQRHQIRRPTEKDATDTRCFLDTQAVVLSYDLTSSRRSPLLRSRPFRSSWQVPTLPRSD